MTRSKPLPISSHIKATLRVRCFSFSMCSNLLPRELSFSCREKFARGCCLTRRIPISRRRYVQAPLCTPANFCEPVFQTGDPLLRRPKHSATALLSYLGTRWGANLGGSFVGRRPDSDFENFGINHAAGYALVDVGGWYAINSHVTAYANIGNALNQHYNEVVGYPALTANFRAGLRFRIGGD